MAARESEDAARLILGPDFDEAQCLLFSEVAILLEHKENERPDDAPEPSDMVLKTLEYTQRFSRLKTAETINEIRKYLLHQGLVSYEVAAMCNLFPESTDEAKALIPTLANRLSDEQIEDLIRDMGAYESKKF